MSEPFKNWEGLFAAKSDEWIARLGVFIRDAVNEDHLQRLRDDLLRRCVDGFVEPELSASETELHRAMPALQEAEDEKAWSFEDAGDQPSYVKHLANSCRYSAIYGLTDPGEGVGRQLTDGLYGFIGSIEQPTQINAEIRGISEAWRETVENSATYENGL